MVTNIAEAGKKRELFHATRYIMEEPTGVKVNRDFRKRMIGTLTAV
jgi:hypothetical protein